MLLPARMAVLNCLNKSDELNVKEIMDALKKDYGAEKQFTYDLYLEHLMALEANGFANLTKYELDETGELSLYYSITEDGRVSVQKYIPKKFR